MTRTNKEAYYLQHDCNARNDIKIVKLRRELGLEGYGIFWCLIEMLREEAEYTLPLASIDDIAFQISATKENVSRVIKEYGLFKIDGANFWSERLLRLIDSRKYFSEAGKKGMQSRWKQSSSAPPLKAIKDL